jgi:hypothetical protein
MKNTLCAGLHIEKQAERKDSLCFKELFYLFHIKGRQSTDCQKKSKVNEWQNHSFISLLLLWGNFFSDEKDRSRVVKMYNSKRNNVCCTD